MFKNIKLIYYYLFLFILQLLICFNIASQFIENKNNISNLIQINPLMAKLAMFNDKKDEELNKENCNNDSTINNKKYSSLKKLLKRIERRKNNKKIFKNNNNFKKFEIENIERREIENKGDKRYFDITLGGDKLIIEENKEEQQQLPPFEVTDSLKLALSSTQPTDKIKKEFLLEEFSTIKTITNYSMIIEQENKERKNDFNIEQSNISSFIFPIKTNTKFPSKSSLFSINQQQKNKLKNSLIMPGAHFYVNQHVSHGRFGREPPLNPKFVYDPNILQNRYGYNGILSQFLPNGKLARFGTGIVNHNKQNGVILLNKQQANNNNNIPSELINNSPLQSSSSSFIFIIPSSSNKQQLPLNIAKSISSTNSLRSSSSSNNNNNNLSQLIKIKSNNNFEHLIMSPLEGNSLKWLPLNLKKEFEKIMKIQTTTTSTISITTIKNIPISSIICSLNQNIILLSSKGYKLADITTKRIKRNNEEEKQLLEQNEMTENECIFSCIVNIAKGKIPFDCTSAIFNELENKCILYNSQNNNLILDGNIRLIPDINSIYFEKGCINNNLINLNNNNNLITIQRIPQKTLIGYAIGTIYSKTLINCLENCLLINNKCKSIMFYYEENNNLNNNNTNNNNCILNSQNYENVPSNYFIDENEVIVDYISLNNNNNKEEEEDNNNAILNNNNIKSVSSKLLSISSSPSNILIPKKLKNKNKIKQKRILLNKNNQRRHFGEIKILNEKIK